MTRFFTLALALAAPLAPRPALAQDGAPDAEGLHTESVWERGDADDDVRLELNAGVALAYGNARNLAFNLGGKLTIREAEHAFLAEIGWLYGMSATRGDIDMDPMTPDTFGPLTETANNLAWRLRYDFFVTPEDALFLVHRGRNDPFARLEPRIGAQAGYMRNLFREGAHRFWAELGYDFTYDRFGGATLLQVGTDPMGNAVFSGDRALHSLRIFIGYDNPLNTVLTYETGFEALMRLDRPEHWRFEWINKFTSAIAEWLRISLDLTARLDSLPPGQAEAWNEQAGQATQMLDILATLNLVGTFDIDGAPAPADEEEAEEEEAPAPACPACECPAPAPCPEPAAAPEPAASEPAGTREGEAAEGAAEEGDAAGGEPPAGAAEPAPGE